MLIGPHHIDPPLILAPMAGVTDRPFRTLCRRLGAGLVVSEMMTSDETLWHTEKSRLRREHDAESGPISVQIAGYDPEAMARTARFNVEQGAQIIDINMGCPAKKVCRVDAGSALMRDERLVARILDAVVKSVDVPVTLKMRTGWARSHRNAVSIARIAEDCGIAALAVHGRTREDHYEGEAEFDTVAEVKRSVKIPVIANGDIDSGEKAGDVLRATGADGLMIGRAALGRPWIFRQIDAFLRAGRLPPEPTPAETGTILLGHLDELYRLYGEGRGVRVARKHIQWYCQSQPGAQRFWSSINRVDTAREQRAGVEAFFFADRVAAPMLAMFVLLATLPVSAAVYRCPIDGKPTYTDKPCAAGAVPHPLPQIGTIPHADSAKLAKDYDQRVERAQKTRDKDDAAWLKAHQASKAADAQMQAAIADHKLVKGMTADQVRRAIGTPDEVERSGVSEEWVYGFGKARQTVGFENGKVIRVPHANKK